MADEGIHSIDDASALALRDMIVTAMIEDACRTLWPIRTLAMAGGGKAFWLSIPGGSKGSEHILAAAAVELGLEP